MKKKVYIIHGYAATPTDHWFQYVKQILENEDIVVSILEMPDSTHPTLNSKANGSPPSGAICIASSMAGLIHAVPFMQSMPLESLAKYWYSLITTPSRDQLQKNIP